MGLSIWTPWSDIFQRLPKRIYAKLLATADMEIKYKPKVLVSQVWNAIIISMYSAAHANVITAPRVYYAMAQDGLFFRRMAEVHQAAVAPAAERPQRAVADVVGEELVVGADEHLEHGRRRRPPRSPRR
mgnify:CR=1 FL=1